MSPRGDAQRTAIRLVAEGHEPTFYELVDWVRQEAGVSSAEANRTVMRLLGNGTLRTTMGSRIVLERSGGGGGIKTTLEVLAAVLGIVASMLGIWEGGVRIGYIDHPGPIDILFPSGPIAVSTLGPIPTLPSFPTAPAPATPANFRADGTCTEGYTFRWDAVPGVSAYRVLKDGSKFHKTTANSWRLPDVVANFPATWSVIAVAGTPESESAPSSEVPLEGCG